ncbi:MAG TPA: hypothetical protein VIS94_03985 [Desulfomonilia bacterium]
MDFQKRKESAVSRPIVLVGVVSVVLLQIVPGVAENAVLQPIVLVMVTQAIAVVVDSVVLLLIVLVEVGNAVSRPIVLGVAEDAVSLQNAPGIDLIKNISQKCKVLLKRNLHHYWLQILILRHHNVHTSAKA